MADPRGLRPAGASLAAATAPASSAMPEPTAAGQRESSWPDRLDSVHYAGGELFVPKPELSRGSVRPERY